MTPAKNNQHRRRGMHHMRDIQALAADFARFDFSTRSGADSCFTYVRTNWPICDVTWFFMVGKKLIIDTFAPAEAAEAERITTNLYNEALAQIYAASGRGYGGICLEGAIPYCKRNGKLHDLTPKIRIMMMTISELAEGRKPRNQHPRKHTGTDGKAVTKTEAANALGVSRPTLYKLLKKPIAPFGDPDNDINYLAAVMSNRANFATFIYKPQIKAWINDHGSQRVELVHPEDITDPKGQQPPAKPSNVHRNRASA